jgi:hypothetical protein
LAHTKGYQLVAYNEGMFNLFFVHNTLCSNDAIRIMSLAQAIETIQQKISKKLLKQLLPNKKLFCLFVLIKIYCAKAFLFAELTLYQQLFLC